MGRPFRAVCVTLTVLLMLVAGLLLPAPNVAALSRLWTTETDWGEPGAAFTSTEVVDTGVPARVELRKDVTDWANRTPASSPGSREGPSVSFSSFNNVTVLFGGYDGMDRDDTWEYDAAANTWARITVNPHPQGRSYAGMSYDPLKRVAVLFGGVNTSDPDIWLTDTWEYDVATRAWSQTGLRGSGPKMYDAPLAYYAGQQRHVLIGFNATDMLMQTWAYDAAANTWTDRTPGAQPGPRTSHATAYHIARDRVVLFGGTTFDPLNLADTWEYDYVANQWVNVPASAPPARGTHGMTYRPAASSVLLFGGQGDAGTLQDTWRYTSAATWEILSTSSAPPARKSAGFAYDTRDDLGVLFGGTTASGSRFGDTWTLGASYRIAGRYASAVFDSGASSVDWQTLWWNRTPANQPPNTYVRFQIATSNNPTGPWSYVGPNGASNTYYTVHGSATWAGHDTQRYLRFLADFGNTGGNTQITPSMEDVMIDFVVPSAPPYIVSEDPVCPLIGVPLTKVPRIVFSEAMNPATVYVNFSSGTPVPWNYVWIGGNSILDLQHAQPFGEAQVYRLLIEGRDAQGDALVLTNTPNVCDGTPTEPWLFSTEAVNPFIASTNPQQGDTNVNLSAPIVATFSEPMNTGSVQWTIAPNLALAASWSGGDSVLTLSHTTPFSQCSPVEVNITSGRDKANVQLVPGPAPNPWSFVTECINPYIVSTSPSHLQEDVATSANVVVTFSESMKPATVQWQLLRGPPVTFSPSWANGNRELTLSHAQPFPTCAVYEMRITGTGADGNSLIAGPPGAPPNPWTWITVCSSPYLLLTRPANGDTNVTLLEDIWLVFSEPMDPTSVSWTITPPVTLFPAQWQGIGQEDNRIALIQHDLFQECTRYTFEVMAPGLVPGPAQNPFSFDTICESPYVLTTDPADGEALVPVTAPIVVTFSEPMDPASVFVSITPAIALTPQWTNNDQTLTLTHVADYPECTEHEVFVDGVGKDGRNLLSPGPAAPNHWFFTTRCPGFYISRTDPADLQQNVPANADIVVEFSQPVDTATFQITLVPSVPLTPVWSAGDTVVTLGHTTPFLECSLHTATVSAKNQTGSSLENVTGSKANPWTFRVACVPPQITSTDPPDGATGVPLGAPVVVNFSEPMLRGSVTWTIVPAIAVTPAWSNGDRTLTLTHTVPFQANTQYQVTIAGTDLDGVSLVPGPVPNPWRFTTSAGPQAPAGLQVVRLLPNDIVLTWRPSNGAADYVVYSSVDRLAPWPWLQLAVVTTTSYTAAGHLSDGLPHYYIVRARDNVGVPSGNSTMGVKLPLSFTFNGGRSNIYWFSLPYRSPYARASDIANELTNAQIDVVAKWNPATQSPILYYWFRGAWRGTDFPITAGDGLYVGTRSSFPWVIVGTDAAVALQFTRYPPPNANIHWLSLPYTSPYTRASDLVRDIEGNTGPGANTKIVEVAKWDAATQTLVRFYWAPAGWTGTDFTLAPGDGIYFQVVANFAWTPRLITPEVP